MRLDLLKKENIISEPFEHLLVDNFIPNVAGLYDAASAVADANYDTNKGTPADKHPYHPVQEIIRDNSALLVDAVNEVWGAGIIKLFHASNLYRTNMFLNVHNDMHWPDYPIRGVLYLDKIKVYGTHLHKSEDDAHPVEVGGEPGQLLLFMTSEKSWHSAGLLHLNIHGEKRFSYYFIFSTSLLEGPPRRVQILRCI